MELTHLEKQALFEQGFVKIPGVVPRVMVNAALRAINHSLGQGIDPGRLPIFRSQSYCPELQSAPVITDLLHKTPAWTLAESAVGEGKLQPVNGGQIALRFPGTQDPPPNPGGHLDGMYTPTNGVPEGTIQNFTLLLGVLLSDLTAPHSGNFTVWPGTHHLFERYFREHGPQSLLNGMPKVPLPPPEQLQGEAGDVVLCHYQLPHGAAANVSPHVRYAVFFRLMHVDHEAHRWDVMTNLWLQWEGMRNVVAAEA